MKYKLIGTNDIANIIGTILCNRGIGNWKEYIELHECPRNKYSLLKNINDAVELFDRHFQAKDPIGILSDSDVDGVTSSSLMYKYIKSLDPDYDVEVYLHKNNKSHGLSDNDFDINPKIKLLIIPDAGTNDIEEHIKLHNNGIECLALDHHELVNNISNSPAVIVNNQISPDYLNKNCCGAHITWEFCKAMDDYYWEDFADKFLDLVAIANICDVMDLKEFDTRATVNEGLNNINNKMLQQLIKSQSFSMRGLVTPHTVGFYIGPLINSLIRLATYDERILLVKAFCEIEDETFAYKKRGSDVEIEENIYEHVVRLCSSYKGKQTRMRDKALVELMKQAELQSANKVVILNSENIIDKSLNGLVAIKISETINKPVLIGKPFDGNLSGSGRNFDNSPVENFRQLVEECPYSVMASGHSSAFGYSLTDIDKSIDWFNEQLKDVSMDKIFNCDFVLDIDNIDVGFIQTIDNMNSIWCTGIKSPFVCIKNISVSKLDIKVQGKDGNSFAFIVDDIKYVAFNLDKLTDPILNFADSWDYEDEDEIVINAIVTCELNEYQGQLIPQCKIVDYEVITYECNN